MGNVGSGTMGEGGEGKGMWNRQELRKPKKVEGRNNGIEWVRRR